MHAAACGNPFRKKCWKGYVGTTINDVPGCLVLRCPDPSCHAVCHDMINSLVSNESKEKYSRYLLRTFVESNHKIKWCPALGYENAIDFEVGSESYNVCAEDAHSDQVDLEE
ncbi:hypothetical protein IFM89_036962 [Coptis chinensis]|uniref:RING-type domain-containing protein n=1 Tax=Coptis chinensis TaxID=261450 RepID=A0A835HF42_9MAGN|nr:hypothetical protein IFM89_036962 [Coptis chinensis]